MGAFVELGRVNVTETKSVVISRRGDGLYSLAQATIAVGDEGKPMNIFFKGAFTLNAAGLLKVRDLIDDLINEQGEEK